MKMQTVFWIEKLLIFRIFPDTHCSEKIPEWHHLERGLLKWCTQYHFIKG